MHFLHHLKGVEVKMENKGEQLIITLSGKKETIAKAEKKLKAIKEICCCGKDDDCC